jgi:hypothetical protein
MKLTIDIIRSYGFKETTSKPDWDDVQVEFETPNGFELSCLTVCCNEPTTVDSLEGLDGYIWIQTKEELDSLLAETYEEALKRIASEDDSFDIDEYL